MLVPVYDIGKVLPKEVKDRIIRKEYSIGELNDIYKSLLRTNEDNNLNFAINAAVCFVVFAFFSYRAIQETGNVIFGLLLGIIFYLIIMIFFYIFKGIGKKQFLKLIKIHYLNDYNKIIDINYIDNNYYGGFIISKNITKNGFKARWVFRKESSIRECNGWNIYSESDTDEYVRNPDNFEIVSAETILKFVPELLKIYNAPYGTDLTMIYNNGVFVGFFDTYTGNKMVFK